MWSWNDLIDPIIYLRDIESFTVTAGLSLFQGQYVGRWPLLMAGALVSVLPMIVLFILAQRHFVRGIAMSGIKG
jgi:multiple sugar transport system permease protein